MTIFRKRETPVENIAFLSICAGIDAVLSLVCALLPGSAIILMLAIPLTSAFASYYCKARYYPIYLIAAAGVCLAVSAWDISNTLFYVIPSLITGAAYGFGIKNKLTPSLVLFVSSILAFGFFYLSLLIVKRLLDVDVQAGLLALVGLAEKEGAVIGFPLFAYAYSLAQMSITHLFIYIQMERFEDEPRSEVLSWSTPIISIVFGSLAVGFSFWRASLSLLSFGLSAFWAALSVIELVQRNNKIAYAFLGVFAVAGFFLFAALYKLAISYGGLGLLGFISIALGLAQVANLLLLRLKKEESKIVP